MAILSFARNIVKRIECKFEIRDDILDFRAFVEGRRPQRVVINPQPSKRVFKHTRLRVGAVENGDFVFCAQYRQTD